MTIYGLDFSHYDAVPSGARVVSEGFAFMTHKAGGDADDAELAAWWSALKGQRGKVLLGAYWVLRRTDGLMAADAFIARLDSQCPGWRDGPFILQLDCEIWNDGAVPAPTKGQIKACADRLRARMPKLVPIVYAPKWVYGDDLTGLGYPLWASSYVTGPGSASSLYPGDESWRWGAYSGQTPAILQYTSSANAVGQTTCDANAYRGTLDQLTALLAPGWEDDMPTVQEFLDGIYRDLRNDESGISQQLDRHLDAAVARALSSAQPYTGAVGARIAGRGWSPMSPWTMLEYVAEALFASGTRADGSNATVQARLERVELALAPADDGQAS